MSEIGAPSGPHRPSSEGPGRVTRPNRSHDNSEHADEENRRDAPRHPHPRTRHHPHDPAVSLSATLAQVKPGAEVTGTVVAFDVDNRLVLRTAGGVYTLEFDGSIPPSVRQAERVTLLITQTDHVIEARLTAADGRALSSPPEVGVTLVRVPNTPASGSPTPDLPAAASSFTRYGPATLKVVPDAALTGGESVRIQDNDIARLLSPPPATVRTGGGETTPVPPAPDQSGASTPGRQAPQTLAFLPPDQMAARPNMGAAPNNSSPDPTRAQPSPGIPAPIPAPIPPPIPAPIPESVLARAPEVAKGLAFVAQISPPGGAAAPAGSNTAAPALAPGQIVHITVAAGSAGGNPSPKGDTSAALPPTATRTEAVVRADPDVPGNDTSTASLPPRHLATPVGDIPLPPTNSLAVGTRVAVTIEPLTPASGQAVAPPASEGTAITFGEARSSPSVPSPSAPPTSASAAPAKAPAPATEIIWPPLAPLPLGSGPQNWPALSSLVAGVQQIDPALGQAISGMLPTPERPVNPVTLLFLNALGMKSPLRLLLGAEGMDTVIKQGGAPTLRALEDDMARLSRLTVEHGGLEWRPHALPIQTGNGAEALLMLVRHAFEDGQRQSREEGDDRTGRGKVTRFVLDLELSRLGPMQVDGIVKTHRFDLILRTGAPLGPGPEGAIEEMFSAALARNGFWGGCSFQIGQPFPLDVAGAIRKAETHSPPRLA